MSASDIAAGGEHGQDDVFSAGVIMVTAARGAQLAGRSWERPDRAGLAGHGASLVLGDLGRRIGNRPAVALIELAKWRLPQVVSGGR